MAKKPFQSKRSRDPRVEKNGGCFASTTVRVNVAINSSERLIVDFCLYLQCAQLGNNCLHQPTHKHMRAQVNTGENTPTSQPSTHRRHRTQDRIAKKSRKTPKTTTHARRLSTVTFRLTCIHAREQGEMRRRSKPTVVHVFRYTTSPMWAEKKKGETAIDL